ncbi:MAG: 4Fe-4S dicluster domain-containing protein [Anaerolineales bacterium]|nr:4Fe-4S dicluster domain-containing protein [Anaerolineales bacterium]MCK5633580.1 4Fe-4S dicluster domain-containing protein [Anaerolineales bacterium]
MAKAVRASAEQKLEGNNRRWGMVIDLDRCTGCQACVVACHAENNIPVVGEQEAARGHSMHWIRIERYWEGEYPNVKARFMPVLCQHCGEAPCEPVCPVFATYHTPEGLNAQVYNRCIGTRFCGSACPYKVRSFNWFRPDFPEPLDQQLNPDVSVRQRGIIEKCSFCVQRIRRVELDADASGRDVEDGEVQPACVQSCPPSALIFGDLNDPESEASQFSRSRRAFRLLDFLGTDPAVIYLKGGETNV